MCGHTTQRPKRGEKEPTISEIDRDGAPSRRRFLLWGGAALTGVALAACTDDEPATSTTSRATTADPTNRSTTTVSTPASSTPGGGPSTTAGRDGTIPALDASTPLAAEHFAPLGTCVLLPEKTAGPFPLDRQLDRRDIREGAPGRPLRLGLRVIDADCAPVAGTAVEIWHCDATGDYSAFTDGGGGKDDGEGTTFLRGTQTAGADGIVEFLTIYPGWYRGRAVHIHLRVHVEGEIVRTSQFFFDEATTARVYRDAPYNEFGPPDTSNAADSIAGDPRAERTLLATVDADTSAGPGTLGLLNLGIPA